jgi:NADPH2:quinone reductase
MRAVVCKEFGPLDRLEVVDMRDPELLPGHVRLRVLASGVNYVDGLLVQGRYQIKPPVPFVPGMEVVGEVVEIAADVDADVMGRRFLANLGFGGYATHAVARADRLVAIPDAMSTGQAASFLQSYLTGWFAFVKRLGVDSSNPAANAGKWLLVLGAGGGVGLAAVDIGVALGYRVIAAASSEDKRRLALERGALHAVDVSLGDDAVKEAAKELSGGGVDVLYDPVGGTLGEVCLRALGEDGNYLVIGFVGGIPKLPANQVLLRNRRVTGVDWGAWAMRNPESNAAMLREVLGLIGEGRLSPVEPTAYPLSRAAEALGDLESRRVAGKVVLLPD